MARIVVGTATGAVALLIGMVLVGLLAVVVQVLVAFAATLATPAKRGRAIGTVTSGVVSGILLARFIAGTLADFGGWRLVYLVSAALMLVMAALLAQVLPPPSTKCRHEDNEPIVFSAVALDGDAVRGGADPA
jgi:MFS family permease